jgi:hypothetical protein
MHPRRAARMPRPPGPEIGTQGGSHAQAPFARTLDRMPDLLHPRRTHRRRGNDHLIHQSDDSQGRSGGAHDGSRRDSSDALSTPFPSTARAHPTPFPRAGPELERPPLRRARWGMARAPELRVERQLRREHRERVLRCLSVHLRHLARSRRTRTAELCESASAGRRRAGALPPTGLASVARVRLEDRRRISPPLNPRRLLPSGCTFATFGDRLSRPCGRRRPNAQRREVIRREVMNCAPGPVHAAP